MPFGGSTFAVKDLNELYIENLKSFNIEEKPQTTRFTERLIASVPNLVHHQSIHQNLVQNARRDNGKETFTNERRLVG